MKLCGYVSSPLNHAMWSLLLSEHPDRQFVGYVVRRLRRGFRVGCLSSAPKLRLASSIMLSAIRHPDVIEKYLHDELEANWLVEVIGVGIDAIHIPRFGTIPKKHQPGKWHLIVDLSSPHGWSINDAWNGPVSVFAVLRLGGRCSSLCSPDTRQGAL